MNRSRILSFEEVEERIQHLLMENSDLRNTLHQNNTYIRQLSVNLLEWQKEVTHIQTEYRVKFEKAKILVLRLKKENAEMKELLAHRNKKLELASFPILVQQMNQVTEESPISMSSFEVIHREPSSEALDARSLYSQNLPVQTTNRTEVSTPFSFGHQCESDTLRTRLVKETEEKEMNQDLLKETQSQLDLVEKWNENQLLEEKPSACFLELEKLQMTNMNILKRCAELEEQVTSLSARLGNAEELALAKQFQNTELKSRILQLENELEDLPILKTQVELYQADFEAERLARQNLAGEKEILAQKVRSLMRQLEAQSQVYDGTANVTAITAQHEVVTNMECPKCKFNFTTMDSLNNHLDVCLAQTMFP